mmetsp:Transcript_15698/g.27281  ORF Transcript_15698/g.27281 Transcript_15698/m.27281 type:complete len:214 (+) Transcript_15698:255-896(+)
MPVTRPSIPVCASNASYDYSSGSWHRVIGSHPPPLQLQSRTWLPLAGKPTTFIRSSHQSARLHCRPPAPFGRPRRAAAHAHVTATVMSFCCTTLPNASHSPGASTRTTRMVESGGIAPESPPVGSSAWCPSLSDGALSNATTSESWQMYEAAAPCASSASTPYPRSLSKLRALPSAMTMVNEVNVSPGRTPSPHSTPHVASSEHSPPSPVRLR